MAAPAAAPVRRPARWVSLGVLVAIASSVALAWEPWSAATWIGASRATGWLAAALLLLTLATSPLSRSLESRRRLGRWRRAFGIGAALAALAHLAIGLAGPLRDALEAVWTWPTYRAGLLATLLMTLLLLTSFPSVVRALRLRVWKPLHRLAYVAALLVALHLVRLPFGTVAGVVFFAAAVAALLGWRLARALGARLSRRREAAVSEASPRG